MILYSSFTSLYQQRKCVRACTGTYYHFLDLTKSKHFFSAIQHKIIVFTFTLNFYVVPRTNIFFQQPTEQTIYFQVFAEHSFLHKKNIATSQYSNGPPLKVHESCYHCRKP